MMEKQFSDIGILVTCRDGTVARLTPHHFLNQQEQLRQFLLQEQMCPTVWRDCSLCFYRLGHLEMFKSFLEKAVDMVTTSFLVSYASKRLRSEAPSLPSESPHCAALHSPSVAQPYPGATPPQNASLVLLTLAGYHIHWIFLSSGCLPYKATPTLHPLDFQAKVERIEGLLRKAQLLDESQEAEQKEKRHPASVEPLVCSRSEYCSVLRGYVFLASYTYSHDSQQRETYLSQARSVFDSVQKVSPNSLLALLGLAAVHYACKQFSHALSLYALVLWMYPHDHVGVRLGMGFCQLNLKNHVRSFQCFQRALQLSPGDTDALVGLYCLTLLQGIPRALYATCPKSESEGHTHTVIRKATQWVIRGYQFNPSNFLIVIILMNLCFLCERLDIFTSLLSHAKSLIRNSSQSAEISYLQGRLFQKKKNLTAAEEQYRTCLQWIPYHLSARYALAQIYLWQNKVQRAHNESMILLRQCPMYIPALKLYSYICLKELESLLNRDKAFQATKTYCVTSNASDTSTSPSTNTSETSRQDYQTSLSMYCTSIEESFEYIGRVHPDDQVVLLLQIRVKTIRYLLGQRFSYLSNVLALYEQLLQITWNHSTYRTLAMDSNNPYWLILCHNLAVCYALMGETKKASTLLDSCFQVGRLPTCSEAVKKVFQTFSATFLFNRALISEHSGDHSDATRLYHTLGADSSNVYSRLAQQCLCWMTLSMSDLAQAKKQCHTYAKSDPKSRHVFVSLLCKIYEKEHYYEKGVDVLQRWSSTEEGIPQSYNETLIGRLYHLSGYKRALKKKSFHHPLVVTQLSLAASHYSKAVTLDPQNWYACNGLIVLLAQDNHLKLALNALSLLLNDCKSTASTNPDDALTTLNAHPDHGLDSSSSIAGLPTPCLINVELYRRRAMCHQNLGLAYLSLAMTDKQVAPDQVNIAKALRHVVAALDYGPSHPFSVYLLLARLLHDALRYRQCQKVLEVALNRWNTSTLFYYNLAYVLGKCVGTEIQQSRSSLSDPQKRNQWIQDCQQSVALSERCISMVECFSGMHREGLEHLRDSIRTLRLLARKSWLLKDSLTKLLYHKEVKEAYEVWKPHCSLPCPSKNLLALPSWRQIETLKGQVLQRIQKYLTETPSTQGQELREESQSSRVVKTSTRTTSETPVDTSAQTILPLMSSSSCDQGTTPEVESPTTQPSSHIHGEAKLQTPGEDCHGLYTQALGYSNSCADMQGGQTNTQQQSGVILRENEQDSEHLKRSFKRLKYQYDDNNEESEKILADFTPQ